MSNKASTIYLSIIIPTLNEAENLLVLLEHLNSNIKFPNQSEIIVVDGGSTDSTLASINYFKNDSVPLKTLESKPGRARQMNTGAKVAVGSILYFLHADSFPPLHFDALITHEVAQNNAAGCFRMKFNSKHWWLKLTSWFTRFNWCMCRGGDQSQFITKELFNSIGGYNDAYSIFEDNILIAELYKKKQFVVIPKTLITSARMYHKKGVFRLQYHYFMIYFKHRMGAQPEALVNYYKKHLSKA